MRLSVLATQYVAYKQDLGMRFLTEARTLRSFCRTMGDVDIAEATAERVLTFIAGSGPVTRSWHRKHEVLRGFYRFARARGCIAASPLPTIIPQATQFVPHVFSQEELRRLLAITRCCQNLRSKLQPYTLRMLILLSYGTGLRISEALSLTLADVDLSARILTIRESKLFYKTRSVPLGRLPPSANPRRRRAPRPLSAATSRPEASCRYFGHADFLHTTRTGVGSTLLRFGIIRGSPVRQPLADGPIRLDGFS